jgi:hydrogenase maturation protein HypF
MEQSQLDDCVDATELEKMLLQNNSRPIVLIKRKPACRLPQNLAPGINRLGVMLPSSPLQYLLCRYFRKPLVATSGNISGEPIITDNKDATKRLANLCDAFLHHDRAIVRPADDPVISYNNSSPQILRTGRGSTPTEYRLPVTLDTPVLAVGGHIKNTIALAWRDRMVISAHNGDLGSLRSQQTFKQAINDLQQLYQVTAEHIICDAHPGYGSTQWAGESGLTVSKVFHHHAHASSLAVEYRHDKSWLVFAWDGVGMGVDGSLWGGETFFGRPGNWQRVASLNTFALPGGDKTSRGAWRVAASLCWQADVDYVVPASNAVDSLKLQQLKMIWQRKMNCPESSAAGRLFSAAAALVGLVQNETYEGHGPMLLEALAETTQAEAIILPMILDGNNVLRIDWKPLIMMLSDTTLPVAFRARCVHETLAECISRIAVQYSEQHNDLLIGLSGGVFQNQLLVQLVRQRLHTQDLDVVIPSSIPVNDGGLCAGQIIEYYFQ